MGGAYRPLPWGRAGGSASGEVTLNAAGVLFSLWPAGLQPRGVSLVLRERSSRRPCALVLSYATIYTMFPVFSLVLDQDVKPDTAMLYPELYKDLTKVRPAALGVPAGSPPRAAVPVLNLFSVLRDMFQSLLVTSGVFLPSQTLRRGDVPAATSALLPAGSRPPRRFRTPHRWAVSPSPAGRAPPLRLCAGPRAAAPLRLAPACGAQVFLSPDPWAVVAMTPLRKSPPWELCTRFSHLPKIVH